MSEQQTILDLLAKVSGVAAAELKPEFELVAQLGIDSPKALRLIADLEDALDIEIEDEAVSTMKTVGDVLAFAPGEH